VFIHQKPALIYQKRYVSENYFFYSIETDADQINTFIFILFYMFRKGV